MRAVTFQEPGRVAIEERPEPEPIAADDAVVRVDASGVCGSDLHIYHGRVQIEPGFTLGHEYVGTVVAAGDGVTGVSEGDRVLGTFHTACGMCFFCRRGLYQQCDEARVFGHGATLGSLQGTQAELALVPRANMKELTEFGGVDVAVEAVGHPAALDTAIRLTRKGGTVSVVGVYAERAEVHMGVFWIKGLRMISGRANVIAHLDSVLAMLSTGRLDVSPLVSREMSLDDAAEAYEVYDRHEALKIVLRA